MRHSVWPGLSVVVALVVASGASAQIVTVPAPEGSITVTAFGSADAAPDWADVKLTVQSPGPSAADALMMNRNDCDRAVSELVNVGIKQENISVSPPRIAGGGFAQMMGDKGEANKYFVTSALTVRINGVKPETVYDDICQIIDTAGLEGAAPRGPMDMAQMMSMGDIVVFGVNEPKPLRDQAIANALEEAQTLGRAAAARSGKKLGDISGLQVIAVGDQGIMAVMKMFAGPPKAGRAMSSVTIAVTFKME